MANIAWNGDELQTITNNINCVILTLIINLNIKFTS